MRRMSSTILVVDDAAFMRMMIRDILAKVHGSTNPVNVTRATINALASLHSAAEISARRGVTVRLAIPGQPVVEAADAR